MSALAQALDSDPDKMTGRARAYMTICAARHILLGMWCLLAPPVSFEAMSFAVVRQMMIWTGNPMHTWGFIFLVTGLLAALAVVTKKEPLARDALIMSSTTTSFWAAGFVLVILAGFPAGYVGTIFLCSLVAKDIVVARQPMRSPFEAIMRTLPRRDQGRTSAPDAGAATGTT